MSNFMKITNYEVTMVGLENISPSPENDDIYGEIEHDGTMDELIQSIRQYGLEQPLYVSADGFIISGHRRHYACAYIGQKIIPVRVEKGIRREGNPEWRKVLAAFNPQRVKDASALLKEALLKVEDSDDEYRQVMRQRQCQVEQQAKFTIVKGKKSFRPITAQRSEFFEATKEMIYSLKEFWPLSVRQCHYNLLPVAPLKRTTRTPNEKDRYVNDEASYKALSRLLTAARYGGKIPFDCIADETRPTTEWRGWDCPKDFIYEQTKDFLNGFQLNLQASQPIYIELLAEKKTLSQIIRPVCSEFHIPYTLGSGYSGPSVWNSMASRFRSSGKKSMVLVVASDYDPEGFDLADDAIRSLRQHFGVDVECVRAAVNREQITELDLVGDFNPAKLKGSRLKAFIERTEGTKTWECEALPPKYLQSSIREAFCSVMDMDVFNAATDQERAAANEIFEVRTSLVKSLGI